MRPIGGYFELELPSFNNFPQKGGFFLNSGRNAFEFILLNLRVQKIKIPYFTCDVILEPLKKLSIKYTRYHINENFEVVEDFDLKDDEYILLNNYFGIKDSYISRLVEKYGSQLIIDNSQALYAKYIKGTNAFYSPRKYVGVPDGGVAYLSNKAILDLDYECDFSYERCSHLLKRIDCGASEGYTDFKENSKKISCQEIRFMSRLTDRLIESIDFDYIKRKRIENFNYLDSRLRQKNKLTLPKDCTYECPMVYPFFIDDYKREELIKNDIFVATYWPNVLEDSDKSSLEYKMATNMICLPIDQRYDISDMNNILNIVI